MTQSVGGDCKQCKKALWWFWVESVAVWVLLYTFSGEAMAGVYFNLKNGDYVYMHKIHTSGILYTTS